MIKTIDEYLEEIREIDFLNLIEFFPLKKMNFNVQSRDLLNSFIVIYSDLETYKYHFGDEVRKRIGSYLLKTKLEKQLEIKTNDKHKANRTKI